jgi:iron complex transport system substrate-binding protein
MNYNPRVRLLLAALACAAFVFWCISCDSRSPHSAQPSPAQTASTAPSTRPEITVASLSPAATDLIIGMGAGGRLVAVSNFDVDRPNVPKLPRVGDYQNTDWERLADLRPSIIIVQIDPTRLPAGFNDRAAEIGAKIIDIQIENLVDIDRTLDQLGSALNERAKSIAAKTRLDARLDSVRRTVSNRPPVATLIALDDRGSSAVGPGTFLDEILTIAGGKNVLADTQAHWPSIDRERLLALSPDAIVELLPSASQQVLHQAAEFWAALPDVPAVAHHRTFQITDPWVLTPGVEVADLAEHLAAILHPATGAATGAATEAKQ